MTQAANNGDTAALNTNPWRDVPLRTIASIAVPFWVYIAISNMLYVAFILKGIALEEIVSRSLQFSILTVLVIFCYKLALRIGWDRSRMGRTIAAQGLLALGFAMSGRFILWVTFSLVMWDPSWMTASRMELYPELRAIGASLVNQLLAYFAGLAVLAGVLSFRRLREVTLRAERAEREYVSARLQALRGQLNPHFLFNTLHSVCGLIDERPGTARTMLVRLGDLLRSSFRDEGQEQVPLADELEMVRSYLEIQKLRFSDRLSFNIDVEVGLEAAAVPRFVLQPLAENAIMHGMADERDHVDIRISARKENGGLELSVVNSSSMPARQVRELGVGLGNTAERLRALYSERATLQFQPDGSAGFVVCVRLPIESVDVAV
jgi:two-component system LytT family sensor kinase